MKPLDGIRVLDLTRHMAGPYATQMLSDYGAEVIKVESVPYGDPSRRTGTTFIGEESGLFLIWNHGKRSFAVDMRSPDGLRAVQRLAATADVLIENYRPGVADKIGLGYDRLSRENPGLIYVSLSAFGSTGPWAGDPGTDPVVQAMSGVMSVTGESDGEPLLIGVPVADFTGAMVAAHASMLGLFAREKTGRGQRAEVSMLHALMSSLTTRLASHWFGGETPGRHGNQHSVVAPYQAFKTSDGHAVAGVWGAGGGMASVLRRGGTTRPGQPSGLRRERGPGRQSRAAECDPRADLRAAHHRRVARALSEDEGAVRPDPDDSGGRRARASAGHRCGHHDRTRDARHDPARSVRSSGCRRRRGRSRGRRRCWASTLPRSSASSAIAQTRFSSWRIREWRWPPSRIP